MLNEPIDNELLKEYASLLQAPSPQGRQKEQVVQDYLEENSVLLPVLNLLNHHLHFRAAISKFPLSTALITDYAYLTKSSDRWRVTLVELESPEKEFFTQSTKKVGKSAAFNAAIDQVRSWKSLIDENEKEVSDRLLPLIQPPNMRRNRIEYRYLLIYGRSANKNLTDARKSEFVSIQKDTGVEIVTYDQVASFYENGPRYKKNILRCTSSGYEFKSVDAGINNMLAFLGPGELFLSKDQIDRLRSEGCDMDAWRSGELLVVNGKSPSSSSGFVFGAKKP